MTEVSRAAVRAAIAGVDGFLHESEAWALAEAAMRARRHAPATIVEIGSFRGRSTIALAKAIRGYGKVLAIDPQEDASYQASGIPSETSASYDLFRVNLHRADVIDVVEPVRKTSHAARPDVADRSVAMLFVDGVHEYHGVRQDIDDWTSSLIAGAEVAFNDPCWPGVNRVLGEVAAQGGSAWRKPRHVYNTLFFTYDPERPWSAADTASLRRLRMFLRFGQLWWKWGARAKRVPGTALVVDPLRVVVANTLLR